MSYVKWLLSAVFVVLCTFLGYKFSERYRLRKKYYAGFYAFNKRMIDEMCFSRNSLLKIIEDFQSEEVFCRVLGEYRISLQTEQKFDCDNIWFLNEEEKKETTEFFSLLGKSDAFTQMNFLKSYEGKLKEQASLTASEEKKFVSMFIKLGVLAGILAAILIM